MSEDRTQRTLAWHGGFTWNEQSVGEKAVKVTVMMSWEIWERGERVIGYSKILNTVPSAIQ